MNNQNSLRIEVSAEIPEPTSAEAVAVCVFADEPHIESAKDGKLREMAQSFVRDGEFKGEEETSLLLHAADANGDGTRRLLLIGLGAHQDFDANTLNRAAAMAARRPRASHIKHLN